jgi:hypothetical protein
MYQPDVGLPPDIIIASLDNVTIEDIMNVDETVRTRARVSYN